MKTNSEAKTIQFTLDEAVFMVSAINGVICKPETLIGNLHGEAEFTPAPSTLFPKLKTLSPSEIESLYHRLYAFWNSPANHIENTEERLIKLGIIENGCK